MVLTGMLVGNAHTTVYQGFAKQWIVPGEYNNTDGLHQRYL